MKPLLQYIAEDLIRRFGTDLSRVAVIFPNKRAALFLNEYISRLCPDSPIWSPAYMTISELFRRQSRITVADQILLISRLHRVYTETTGLTAESLDQFYGWGQLILADFDDIDKNMADADKVFALISNLHEYDNTDFLSEEQKEALKRFFNVFNDDHSSMLKNKFLHLWNKLGDIYHSYREALRNDNIAYEGMMYRDVVEQPELSLDYDCYCFVGFNMLHEVEQTLFQRLKQEGKALFYWDYDNYYLKKNHEAGHFIRQYINAFPDAIPDTPRNSFLAKSKVEYISATTENLQARYVYDWLMENDRWKDGARTAIIMSDESLLQTILRSLPPELQNINITIGYPLGQSPSIALVQHLFELQTAGLISGSDAKSEAEGKYNLRYVKRVLQHPYMQIFSDKTNELYSKLTSDKIYYPTRNDLVLDDNLAILFSSVDSIKSNIDGIELNFNTKILLWIQNIIHIIALKKKLDALYQESLFKVHQLLQRLINLSIADELPVDVTTLRRLFQQIVDASTIPFHGEPVEGVQIMGVLETRCLDFDHVLILSCNEGNLPKGVNDASLIPHSVRKAYGLTTIDNKVSIFSYYFHRLIQRASDVTITYNSSTDGINTGEMSRFMLQMMVESGLDINRISLRTGIESTSTSSHPIAKVGIVKERLEQMLNNKEKLISPSSLGTYLRCQLMYFYRYVMELYEDDGDEMDEMDNRVFGLIFHKSAEVLYKAMCDSNNIVHSETIEAWMKNKRKIAEIVDAAFAEELFHIPQGATFHPEYSGLQLINRKVIIKLLGDMMAYDKRNAPFKILGLEKKVSMPVSVDGHIVTIGGFIDRLDIDRKGTIRVIDYKTGMKIPDKLKDINDVFDPAKIKDHSNYALQSMMYSIIVKNDKQINPYSKPVSPSLLYAQHTHKNDYSPVVCLDTKPIDDITEYEADYMQLLVQLIRDIHDTEHDFTPVSNEATCKTCPYLKLCHR